MKKIVGILILTCIVINCYAQTEKGKILAGGQFNISNQNTSTNQTGPYTLNYNSKDISFTISPNAGYFIRDNVVVGLRSSFGMRTYKVSSISSVPDTSSVKNTSNSYSIGVFARSYKKVGERLMLFIDGSISYSYQILKNTDIHSNPSFNPNTSSIDNKSVSVSIAPGLVYFITPKMGIQATYGNLGFGHSISKNRTIYTNSSPNSNSKNITNNWGLNLSFSSIYLGMNFYF